MALKFPPPPYLASQDPETQQLNRWLLEIQSILDQSGGIDPSEVTGLPDALTQVAENTANITTLQGDVGGNTTNITALTADVSANTVAIASLNSQVTTLESNAVVRNGSGVPASGLGNNGDLYLNNTGGAGTRLYGKIAGAWVSIA